MGERWIAGKLPVTVWVPTGRLTRRGPEMAPSHVEHEWAAWPEGDDSRAVFCASEAEALAIVATRPATHEAPRG